MLVDDIRRFVRDPAADDFDRLAIAAFRFQYERLEPYRKLCRAAAVDPAQVESWRQVPPIPTLAFKSLDLAVTDDGETFRSSGTTGSARSVHRHTFLDLYRDTIDASFPQALLGSETVMPILSLIPTREQVPDSSLSFMVEHIRQRFGAPTSITAIGERGVDARKIRGFLAASQRSGRPLLILGTAFALVDLLAVLARFELRFRLPAGSVVFETGGYKGRSRELTRAELVTEIGDRLSIPASHIVREYGMTELTSQFYTDARRGGNPDLFLTPHWSRVRVLDPQNLAELPPQSTGLITVFDLANLSSAVHVLTQDLGQIDDAGFRLLGRAAGAELRGCSLTVEELARQSEG